MFNIRAICFCSAAILLSQFISLALFQTVRAETVEQSPPGSKEQPIKKSAKSLTPPKAAARQDAATTQEPAVNAHDLPDGQTSTVETTKFGDWTVVCDIQNSSPKVRNCAARSNIQRSKEDARLILAVGVLKDAESQRFILQTPTALQLKPGVQIAFGNSAPRRLEFVSCEPSLCTAEVAVDAGLMEELTGSTAATVTWSTIGLGDAKVEFHLNGAKAAIEFLAGR